ncbi:hypothetical protein PSZ80_20050 [Shigella sonnei]|jgi:hypothetical protein|uniref:Uncharacterized protein n=10 Tax=Enterobacteriaceae TaxID=543 RepID=A0A0H0MBD6_ECOLX|nr:MULTISPECIES: hypothetical protein [Enterobacteriaceae]EFP8788268.1 hypothetical protein [Shigella flexneri]EFZ3599361.1 hypothetical protein [Shigella boydii]EHT2177749.1 hypothetical protein [Escherichia coli O116]EHV73057.1 hypothetical protein ECDEC6D_1459 [Escherichia coli DEC6D]EHX31633.1 hypothetical protein ECDEC12B_1942 [Escherichia coli DEC12B]EHX35780.1 hypothetical protein ECDEC12C_1389 [Escherichia coli DEC12C]EHY1477707.1 hypothetical protein [Escherichia coli O157]EIE12017
MSNTQKIINTEKYNEWVKKFSEQIFKITGDENVAKNELEPWTPEGNAPNYCWWEVDPVDAANEAMSYHND